MPKKLSVNAFINTNILLQYDQLIKNFQKSISISWTRTGCVIMKLWNQSRSSSPCSKLHITYDILNLKFRIPSGGENCSLARKIRQAEFWYMISKDRNFYSYNYYSTPKFLHGQILWHLDNPDPNPVENENRIQSKLKEIQISGRIVLSNPDPVHH